MSTYPKITIVTPSYNQGQYIGENIESLFDQHYPNLEHIVVDGGSNDNTLEVLEKYNHIKYISETDNGQAEAINKGFKMATGEIYGVLNSDDTLLPNTLHRVAKEINPASGKHIVMGRCRFVDNKGHYYGIEHPSKYKNHIRILKIWKGHWIPQPSVFWTKEVWEICGGMDEGMQYQWIDYDLFCRFSQSYDFFKIEQVFSTYRLHDGSKSENSTEEERLEECVAISKRYWGKKTDLSYWHLNFSLMLFRLGRINRARQFAHKAREAKRQGKFFNSIVNGSIAGVLAPDVVFNIILYPRILYRFNQLHKIIKKNSRDSFID